MFCLRFKQFVFSKKTNIVYCTIIFYHSIRDDEVLQFRKQMDIIKKLTTTIPLGYEGPFNNKVCYSIVTFDDAFRSVLKNALPDMENLEIPFTVFIPAGQLGANPGWLKDTGDKDESEIISSADELLSIPSETVTFGSHTINHHNLRQLDHEKACIEIKESKRILESQLQKEIKYFAFPFGAHDSKIVKYCHEAGYKQVFSIVPESPYAPLRKYVKGRTSVDPSDWKIEFMLKILGGYGWKSVTRTIRKILKN